MEEFLPCGRENINKILGLSEYLPAIRLYYLLIKKYPIGRERCDNLRRGDIYYADLRPVVGSEQGGVRPVLIIQNDVGNRHSPTVVLLEQLRTIDKKRLKDKVCHLDENIMKMVNRGLKISLELDT